MRAKLESGASFSFVWLTILIILLIPIFALIQNLLSFMSMENGFIKKFE